MTGTQPYLQRFTGTGTVTPCQQGSKRERHEHGSGQQPLQHGRAVAIRHVLGSPLSTRFGSQRRYSADVKPYALELITHCKPRGRQAMARSNAGSGEGGAQKKCEQSGAVGDPYRTFFN